MFQENIILNEVSDTSKIGALLAKHASEGDLITLSGILGSGKTTLARGFIKEAGISDPIPSPTFTIVQTYNSKLGEILHVDAWRLETINDTLELGLEDAIENSIILIEWPEKIHQILPKNRLEIKLSILGNYRTANFSASNYWKDKLKMVLSEYNYRASN